MPIDAMNKVGAAANRVAAATPARPAAPDSPGQASPSGGKVLPPGAGGVPDADMQQAVSRLASYVQAIRRDLQFSVDERSGKAVVRVVDSETGETIRQIPPEEVLAISRALTHSMEQSLGPGPATGGILLNDKA
jgi:flagellar protein FlaG